MIKHATEPKPVSYQLHIRLSRPTTITVGQLGRCRFPAGRYVYTGSARRNLEARIRRHQSASKKRHWHIDYLLTNPAARSCASADFVRRNAG